MSEFIEINNTGKQKEEFKGKRIELSKNYAKCEYEVAWFKYGELTYVRYYDHYVESYTVMYEYEYTDFDEYGYWTKRVVKHNEYFYLEEREINYR